MSANPNPYEAPRHYGEPPLVAQVVPDDAQFVVNFETTMDDVLAWNAFFQRNSATMRRYRLIVLLVVIVMVVLVPVFLLPQFRTQALFWFCLAIAAALFALSYLRMRGRMQWSTRLLLSGMYREGRNLNVFGPRQIALTPDYLLYSAPLSQSIWRWQGIERVVRDGDYLFLQASSVAAIIVPRRAFVDEAAFARFVLAATEYQARTQPVLGAGAAASPSA